MSWKCIYSLKKSNSTISKHICASKALIWESIVLLKSNAQNLWVINTYLFRKDDHSDGRIFHHLYTMRIYYMDHLDFMDVVGNLELKKKIYRSQQIWSTTSCLKIVNDFGIRIFDNQSVPSILNSNYNFIWQRYSVKLTIDRNVLYLSWNRLYRKLGPEYIVPEQIVRNQIVSEQIVPSSTRY